MLNFCSSFRPAMIASMLVLTAIAGSPAHAQYQWRDANGQMIISDQPPPASIKPSQIIKSAPMAAPAAPAPKAEAKDSKSVAAKGPMTTAEKEADFQKRRKEQAEAQKTGAEKQAAAEQKTKHCEALQQKIRTLGSEMRINNVQKNGEIVAMEAAEREKEMSRASRELSTSKCSS
jgi:Domain of unknown function (DUF4124)